MPRQSMYRITIPSAITLLILSLPLPAPAFDWLKQTQELLGGGQSSTTTTLSNTDIAAGLKEALRVGSERVVAQLGKTDGFNADPKIHIPLPQSLEKARKTLAAIGMGGMFDDLELKLNRAAEAAVPEAKGLFLDAIAQMTLEDAKAIYNGPEDAATRYFQGKMSAPLSAKMEPIVAQSLEQVGAVQAYDAALGQYRTLPFVSDVKADLNRYVVDKGMDGVFYYLAREEAAIRQNPAKRTTELLQKVFGGK
jgi:Protein of unknown function (DUF4197)